MHGSASILAGALVLLQGIATAETLQDMIQRHTYDIQATPQKLTGPGMDFLHRETRNSQFICLAEPHNVKQVPQFTELLFRQLHKAAGFDYLALEQGPLITHLLSQAGTARGIDGVAAVARSYPHALHFDTDQELRLIAGVAAIPGAPIDRVWGLDRILSAPHVLERLAHLAPDEQARQQALSLLEEVRSFNQDAEKDLFLVHPTDRFELLQASFYGPPGQEPVSLLNHLVRSHRNLQLHRRAKDEPTGYEANLDREEGMKDSFLSYYAGALDLRRTSGITNSGPPRVILKFGHWHLIRGLNRGNVHTLGNFLAALARVNGLDSFHITIQPINRPGHYWSLSDYPDFKPLSDAGDPDTWRLVDLRPLRSYVHAGRFKVSPNLEKDIFGFDAVLLMGGAEKGTRHILDGTVPASR